MLSRLLSSIFPQKRKLKKIVLGICAMDKKAQSKPMKGLLQRFPPELFEIIIFGDDCILNQPIESWPIVEVLISFYSTRFPTEKALQYVQLRKPFLINDLSSEAILKDRRKVYDILEANSIDVPLHVYVNREEGKPDTNVIEEFDEVSSIFFFFFAIYLSNSLGSYFLDTLSIVYCH
jgi:inositol hexakisphosphate/diphosphoinositol-pentakisphosphate kinase